MRYERAVSISVGSIPRTPSIVFSSTGNMQKNAMKLTFWRLPIECSRMTEIGSSAGGGIARQYSMCGIANRRDQSERPSGMPMTMPRDGADPEAEQDPHDARHHVGAELLEEPELLELAAIVVGGGKYRLSALAAHSCQATTIATGTAISAPTLSADGSRAHSTSARWDGCQRKARAARSPRRRGASRGRARRSRGRVRRAVS